MRRELSAGGVVVRQLCGRWVVAAIRVYVYNWAGERVFKVVSFVLFRYSRGRLGDIPPAHAHELAATAWLPLDEAPRLLAYKGEREMAARALDRLGSAG